MAEHGDKDSFYGDITDDETKDRGRDLLNGAMHHHLSSLAENTPSAQYDKLADPPSQLDRGSSSQSLLIISLIDETGETVSMDSDLLDKGSVTLHHQPTLLLLTPPSSRLLSSHPPPPILHPIQMFPGLLTSTNIILNYCTRENLYFCHIPSELRDCLALGVRWLRWVVL